jgi:hypothetical protein
MSEPVYLARFVGGPLDGQTRRHPGPWPLPDGIVYDLKMRGRYHKQSESQLERDMPGVARGAEYLWKEK